MVRLKSIFLFVFKKKRKKKKNRSEITEVNLFCCSRHPLMEQLALSIAFLFFPNHKFLMFFLRLKLIILLCFVRYRIHHMLIFLYMLDLALLSNSSASILLIGYVAYLVSIFIDHVTWIDFDLFLLIDQIVFI